MWTQGSSCSPVSRFLSPKTSSWQLAVTLTHSLLVLSKMHRLPPAASPNVTTHAISKCNDTRNIVNGNSSGIGCCHMDIPEGLKDINFSAYSFNSHKDVWSFNPCSFAFIIQKDKFSFSSAYLTSLQNNETIPMVLDWAIGNETCEVARKKRNYICGANSNCSDLKNGSGLGYRCKCTEGYNGNPYLKDGCQGIYSIYLLIYNNFLKNNKRFIFFTNFKILP